MGPLAEKRRSRRSLEDDHEAPVWSLAFAGSRRLASSTSSELRVKDLATGEVVRLLDYSAEFGSHPRVFARRPNPGHRCQSGRDPALGRRNLYRARAFIAGNEGGQVRRFLARRGDARPWPPGARTKSRYTIRASARPIAVLDGHAGEVNILAFSPDGSKLVAADSASQVCIWDLASRQSPSSLASPCRGHLGARALTGRRTTRDRELPR